MKQYLLSAAFGLYSFVAIGQRSLQDFVVTTAGDTLRGNLIINNKSAVKLRQPGATVTLSPTEIRSYGDKSGVMGHSLMIGAHGQPQFVIPLVLGPVSLYTGTNKQGDKGYFLQVPDTTHLVEIPLQTAQLTFHKLLSSCPSLEFGTTEAMRRYPSNYQGLTRLVMAYNACTKPQATSQLVKSAVGFRLLYGIKAGLHTATYRLSYEPYSGQVQNAMGYQAGVFLQASNKTHLSLVLEATYQALRGTYTLAQPSAGVTRVASIDYTQLQIPLLLRYTLSNGTVRPFLTGGLVYATNISNQSAIIDRPDSPTLVRVSNPITTPEGIGLGFTGGVGAVIRRGSLPELGVQIRYDKMRYGNRVYYTPHHAALRFDVSVGF